MTCPRSQAAGRWYYAAGHQLDEHGPTPEAFTFKQRFGVPGSTKPPTDMRPEPYCV